MVINMLLYYLNNFFLYSIFGYFFETFMFTILDLHNQSGFMFLWWTPFYGVGVSVINLIYKYIKDHFTGLKKHLILMPTLFIILSLLELLGGVLLELLHGYGLWTYESVPLHIGRYISIPTSTLWVVMSYLYLFLIKKYSDKLVNKIPKWITIISSLIFIADFMLTNVSILVNRFDLL